MLQAVKSSQQRQRRLTGAVRILLMQHKGLSSTLHIAQHGLWSERTQTAPQIQWQTQSAAIMAMLASTTKAVSTALAHHAANLRLPFVLLMS